jgi:hypothetical protein
MAVLLKFHNAKRRKELAAEKCLFLPVIRHMKT